MVLVVIVALLFVRLQYVLSVLGLGHVTVQFEDRVALFQVLVLRPTQSTDRPGVLIVPMMFVPLRLLAIAVSLLLRPLLGQDLVIGLESPKSLAPGAVRGSIEQPEFSPVIAT